MTLRDEILTGPKAADCAPYVVTNDMPKDLDYMAKDQVIADILNAGRAPKIIKREVGDGLISLALGVPAGPVFLMQLEMLSNMPVTQDTPLEQMAQIAVARQAWRSLIKGGFDVGDMTVRAGLDMFVGSLLTAEQASAIKALAESPDIVTAADVSIALRVEV
ncbi:MAG: hypothetical protein GYA66_01570 [Phyllobacteriaceae bacterium]|nr:hypothetical protein [Phyllobacteriaceae bacterium]